MKELKVFFKKDPFNLLVLILSVIILIMGTIVVNFLIGLLIFIVINLIWIIPFIKWKKKLMNRDKARKKVEVSKTESSLNEKDLEEKVNIALEERSDMVAKKGRKKGKTKKNKTKLAALHILSKSKKSCKILEKTKCQHYLVYFHSNHEMLSFFYSNHSIQYFS